MPKMKSKSGAKKRFKLTASGKIKRKRAFKRHILEHKNGKKGRQLRQGTYVSDSDMKQVKRMLLLA